MPSLRKAALALSTLVLFACPQDSPTPLGPASEGRIEPLLLGSWRCSDEDGGEPSFVSFRQFDETQYLVVAGTDTEREPFATYRAYSSAVLDASFLNVQELTDDTSETQRGFVFLRYSLPDEKALELELIDFDVAQAVQDSGQSPLQVLEAALFDPDTFVPLLDCARQQEGDEPPYF